MDKYLANANACLEHADKLPKGMLKGCSGIILISAREVGLIVSGTSGAGVLMSHKDGSWSPPVAVKLSGFGGGAVIGFEDKEMVVVLGHRAAEKLVEGDVHYQLGATAGFAIGKVGREGQIEVGTSDKGGLGMSYVYTYTKGIMASLELEHCTISEEPHVNLAVYHKGNTKDIIKGPVTIPDDIKEFMAKVEKLTAE